MGQFISERDTDDKQFLARFVTMRNLTDEFFHTDYDAINGGFQLLWSNQDSGDAMGKPFAYVEYEINERFTGSQSAKTVTRVLAYFYTSTMDFALNDRVSTNFVRFWQEYQPVGVRKTMATQQDESLCITVDMNELHS